ncbi:hypothetical protein GCM10023346_13780 [Arthrobacter gyeryongensis]|uniref:SnoaL-like domain-containing protein n=1 Tax=Arthrobacter gyeryongensis TaxID=1650592 RepID=A0ABP9S7T3_9MICC
MTDPQKDANLRGTTLEELEWLIAGARINKVLVDYCQGVDRRDWALVLNCYHEDAADSHGPYVGAPAGLVEWMRRNHEYVTFCMHVLSNVSIKFSAEDPSLARVESYCLSRKTIESAEQDPLLAGTGATDPVRRTVACRYIDTFENRPGVGWRISKRTVVHEWMRRDPAHAFVELDPAFEFSRRDNSDLLYSPVIASLF